MVIRYEGHIGSVDINLVKEINKPTYVYSLLDLNILINEVGIGKNPTVPIYHLGPLSMITL